MSLEIKSRCILNFIRSSEFSRAVVPFYTPTSKVWELIMVVPQTSGHWVLSVFLMWYILVVVIYSSLLTKDVQHFFMCLLAIRILFVK